MIGDKLIINSFGNDFDSLKERIVNYWNGLEIDHAQKCRKEKRKHQIIYDVKVKKNNFENVRKEVYKVPKSLINVTYNLELILTYKENALIEAKFCLFSKRHVWIKVLYKNEMMNEKKKALNYSDKFPIDIVLK